MEHEHDDLLPRGGTIGRYVVIGLLGRGGMGTVYAAYDPELDRKVAVKLVRAHRDKRVGASEGRARLLREAQAIAKLSHPNVVVVYDVGTFEDSVFLAMEFLDGHTVGFWREQARRSWHEVLAVYLAAGRGLAAAHRGGLVHRDFKPDNVMVTRGGEVRVMDFGLARLSGGGDGSSGPVAAELTDLDPQATMRLGPPKAEDDEEMAMPVDSASHVLDHNLTEPGVVLGTPAYMAPEQFGGKPTDARADQFSFCVALYEGLYGVRPFTGKTIAELVASMQRGTPAEVPVDSKVPAWLRRTLLRGLQVDPVARYPSMEALLTALSHDPAVARRRWLTVAVGAVAVVAVGTAGRLAWRASQQEANRCEAGAQRLAGIWEGADVADSPRKAAIQGAFAATGLSYAPTTFARVQQTLDRYVDAWAHMYRDTCQATHVRGEQSAEVLDLRMSCLSERLGRVKALTDLFTEATPTIVENAVGAATALPTLERCTDVKLLRSITVVPEDPAVRARVAELERDLARVRALGDSGQCATAATAGRKLIADAKTIGYLPLETASLVALGRSGGECMSVEDLVRTDRDAVLAAAASHDDAAGVEAMILLAYMLADRTSDVAQSHNWSDLAEATLRGMGGGHAVLHAWSVLARGRIESKEGKQNEALQSFRRARELMEKAEGRDHPNVAKVVVDIGVVLEEMGRLEDALVAFSDAERLATGALGPDHPLVALSLANAGWILNRLHRYEAAEERLQRSLDIWRRSGSSPFYVAWALTGLGTSSLALQRPAEARGFLEGALRLVPDEQAPYLPSTRFSLAQALWASPHDRHRAVDLAQRARAGSQRASDMVPPRDEIDAWLQSHVVAP